MPWPMLAKAKAVYDKVKDTASFIIKASRPARAEFVSTWRPEKTASLTESTFERPLRRLQHPSTKASILDSVQRVLAGTVLPAHVTNESARQFFDKPGVIDALRELQSIDLLHQKPPANVVERLAQHYEEIASANSQESAGFLTALRALLVANVTSRVDDVGGAAVTVAVADVVVSRLDVLQAGLARLEAGSTPAVVASELDDQTVRAWRTALHIASQALLGWRTVVGSGGGLHIQRPELRVLQQMSEQTDGLTCALLGDPGAGKSALMSRLATSLLEQPDVTVLAIKADLIDAGVATEADLQRDLALPELPSVMLGRLSKKGRVFLLLDQVDALADRLDVRTARLSLLLSLVKQISTMQGVHIFLSCRRFEFTHDVRLSGIHPQELGVCAAEPDYGVGPILG